MAKIFDLKKLHKETLDRAEKFLTDSESAGRSMTAGETAEMERNMAAAQVIADQIRAIEGNNSILGVMAGGKLIPGGAGSPARPGATQKSMSAEYTEAFLSFVRSGGKQATSALSDGFDPIFGGFALPALPGMSSALYEGSSGAGGYAVSVPTDSQIVPLGMPDIGVRSLARVIPTATDIKLPVQTAFGTAGVKSESGGSTYTFSESDPTLSQFTLSAFQVGLTHTVSWELLQDVQMFQQFGIQDLLNAIAITEDGFFVSGSGSGQPQGLVGNVCTGTGSAYALTGTASTDATTLLNSTFDVVGTLKASYFPGAAWLMSRATGAAIRKAQMQSNLYAPVWTRENGRDYLHGYPVAYSGTMPALPTATTAGVTPLLFGSFADGYVIGDRGGSGTFVKILDQALATSGQTILLGYKRVDGRVRRSEAIQGVSFSHA